jgi:hypothetical protein
MTRASDKSDKGHSTKKRLPLGERPGGLAANRVTSERWRKLLHAIANGSQRPDAIRDARITESTYHLYLIQNPNKVHELREAELAWIRTDWPIERIERMLTEIALGSTNKEAALELNLLPGELEQFLRIIFRDPDLRQLYDEARQMQVESWGDDIIDISNMANADTYLDDKGKLRIDGEVVNRSKLKIAARQWLMARLHHERYGDRIKTEVEGDLVVNHVELLDGARRRREIAQAHSKRLTDNVPVDSEVVPPPQQVH